jgi:ABC-type polar amino acid transport system ATPase subunit
VSDQALVLRLRAVTVRRGARTILEDVGFSVARGELVALMGPSGSGKTTILRTIAGLDPFDAGSIVVDTVSLPAGGAPTRSARAALRRKVGLVFQFHYLFEHLSVLKNVWLAPVHAFGEAQAVAERRALELLRALGVEHRANALPRELSGGEAQRVAIARALAVDPPLLLMDEPTASLDAQRKAEVGELLRRLTTGARTLLVATHDEAFARDWATRIIQLRN